ncbi:MAG TPA: DUF624 domain-containing protein [Capillibacterium sp.]
MRIKIAEERNLFLILKQSAIDIYNHLGYSLLISVLWCMVVLLPLLLIINPMLQMFLEDTKYPLSLLINLAAFGVPYAAFILGPVHTALFYQMNEVLMNEARFRGFWEGFRKHYWLAARVYALYAGMLIFCFVDLMICFFTLQEFGLKILGCFLIYLFLFLLFWSLYLPGFLVLQKNTLKKVFRKTFLVVLDNIFLTIGAFLLLVLIGLAFYKIIPLLIFFYGSYVLVVMIHLFNGVLAKYPDPAVSTPEE